MKMKKKSQSGWQVRDLNLITTQKNDIVFLTAVKTSNLIIDRLRKIPEF
jgi:hypothetical protein